MKIIITYVAITFVTLISACNTNNTDPDGNPDPELFAENFENTSYTSYWNFSQGAHHTVDNTETYSGSGSLYVQNPAAETEYQTAEFTAGALQAAQTYQLVLAMKLLGSHNSGVDFYIRIFQDGVDLSTDPGFNIEAFPLNTSSADTGWMLRGFVFTTISSNPVIVTIYSGVGDLWLDDMAIENFEHINALGCNFSSCHSSMSKSAIHPLTSNDCPICHLPNAWLPTIAPLNHAHVFGACSSCHNGTIGRAKPFTHPATTPTCEACHNVDAWNILILPFDHGQVVAVNCVSSGCHSANDKSVNHPVTSDNCEICHTTSTWLPVAP